MRGDERGTKTGSEAFGSGLAASYREVHLYQRCSKARAQFGGVVEKVPAKATRRPPTLLHGGVTGKAGDRLPMPILLFTFAGIDLGERWI